MNQRFDYEKIDVVDFLKGLGVRNVRDQGYEVSYSCPFVDGHRDGLDTHPSATMSKVTIIKDDGSELPPTTFYCFTCGKAGTAVSFLAEYEGVSPLIARKMLKERFGMAFREPQGSFAREISDFLDTDKRETEVERIQDISPYELNQRWLDWHDLSSPPVRYMIERGFSSETLSSFAVGYDKISDRISIPVFDEHNRLVGFKGRTYKAEDSRPRYMVLGGKDYNFEPYDVSKVLFALPRAIQTDRYLSNDHALIVTEGELNAISMHQKDFVNTVGISGQYLSDVQAKLLTQRTTRVMLMFDDDEKAITAAKKLEKKIRVSVAPYEGSDPADSTLAEIQHRMAHSYLPYMINF